MKRLINKVCIFGNNDIRSLNVRETLIEKLLSGGFEVVEEEADLCIAIGGDGAFLRMIKKTNFNSNTYYIGINTGTLGFAQEVKVEDLDSFIDKLNNNEYKIEEIGVEEVTVTHSKGTSKFYALNEITVRDMNLNTCKLDVFVEDELLENFVGDGLLISTSFGSTAYNLSFGGAIVYNELHTLQITSIAPLNSKVYRNLMNSIIIPQDKKIVIKPHAGKASLIITVDGENVIYEEVESIQILVRDKYISRLQEQNYNFINKVNEKFLK